jgi:NADH-quinone oxidoreductase subunit M
MWTVLLTVIPFITGVISFGIKGNASKIWAFAASLVTLAVAIIGVCTYTTAPEDTLFSVSWIPQLSSHFSVGLDGMSAMLCLLNAIAYPIVFLSSYKNNYEHSNRYFGFMLLAQAGMMGVFTATDALLFYAFWELALVPMYFLCSTWGGEKRIRVTFKFFIYTFIGSLLMLVGILYLYSRTPGNHSFALNDFIQTGQSLDAGTQSWLFWLFFVAFAVKMPIFPFHTWQPDTYQQAPTPVAMILSGVMVKMGLYGLIRWILPVLPSGVAEWSNLAMILSIIGIVYASCIAIVQNDLKKLVAYSSIAHIGLMSAVIFSGSGVGMQGVLIQMFNHGINIIGLWLIVDMVERKLHTHTISELGGIAKHARKLATALVIISLANVALPLTNGFVGEFLMFSGLYVYNGWMMFFAGLGVILVAVYMLNMLQKVIFGESNGLTQNISDLTKGEWLAVAIVIIIIIWLGIYPQPMFNLIGHSTLFIH